MLGQAFWGLRVLAAAGGNRSPNFVGILTDFRTKVKKFFCSVQRVALRQAPRTKRPRTNLRQWPNSCGASDKNLFGTGQAGQALSGDRS